ncbi:MAG TPA: LLM class flavin-dependent oxidoreductase, partial [Alphaproteobacteria bacterium]|nr:LLM class flavin-dependent oxidoreductase [Alphaproteobacteria bacterium]
AQEGAAEAGLKLKLGERMGIVRDIVVADTDAEAQELAKNAGAFLWTKFFQPFG